MKYLLLCLLGIVSMSLISCDLGRESPQGFSLPQGSEEQGKQVFLKHQCLACHTINGLEPPAQLITHPNISVHLGGASSTVKTYADLLTSIINPSHKFARGYKLDVIQVDGVSNMKNYNDVMTVTELVDLVTFLQPAYTLVPYKRSNYQHYGY